MDWSLDKCFSFDFIYVYLYTFMYISGMLLVQCKVCCWEIRISEKLLGRRKFIYREAEVKSFTNREIVRNEVCTVYARIAEKRDVNIED